jgi:hypothetical protein
LFLFLLLNLTQYLLVLRRQTIWLSLGVALEVPIILAGVVLEVLEQALD